MLRYSAIAILSPLLIAANVPAMTVLAKCGGSTGVSYFANEQKWEQDGISRGEWTFIADGKSNPNVIYKDTTGSFTDSAADGGRVSFTFIHPERGEFGLSVVYEQAGVVETYNIIRTPSGGRIALWTANKSNSANFPRVSAFVATCE